MDPWRVMTMALRRSLQPAAVVVALLLLSLFLALCVRSYSRCDALYYAWGNPGDPLHEAPLFRLRSRRGEVETCFARTVSDCPATMTAANFRPGWSYYAVPAAWDAPGMVPPHRFMGVRWRDEGDTQKIYTNVSGRRVFTGVEAHRAMELVVPAWYLIAFAAAMPIYVTLQFIRRRMARPAGCCQACGYDLRATPTRCPECGAVPALQTLAVPPSPKQ